MLLLFIACSSLKSSGDFIPGDLEKHTVTGLEAADKLKAVFNAYNKKFTSKEEYYIGRTVAKNILKKYRRYGNGKTRFEQYISNIGHTLAMASQRPSTFQGYRFIVIKSKKANVFAAPGGYIFITTGMIALAKNEDELAGVLAHGISHVVLKHPLRTISQSQKRSAVADLAKFGVSRAVRGNKGLSNLTGAFKDIIDEITESVQREYTAQLEKEADLNSVDLLIKTGYSPKGLSSMLRKIKAKEDDQIDPKIRAKYIDKKITGYKKLPKILKTRTRRFQNSLQRRN